MGDANFLAPSLIARVVAQTACSRSGEERAVLSKVMCAGMSLSPKPAALARKRSSEDAHRKEENEMSAGVVKASMNYKEFTELIDGDLSRFARAPAPMPRPRSASG